MAFMFPKIYKTTLSQTEREGTLTRIIYYICYYIINSQLFIYTI